MENKVAVVGSDIRYPLYNPFHPGELYPECSALYEILPEYCTGSENRVYSAVREMFRSMDLNSDLFGTTSWNPLQKVIKAGSKVLIKPNLVLHDFPEQKGKHCVISHPSLIRVLIDYVLLATKGHVDIIVADVPLQTANWDVMINESGYGSMINWYKGQGVKISLIDLRRERANMDDSGYISEKVLHNGDPLGYVAVNVGAESAFSSLNEGRNKFHVGNYRRMQAAEHHTDTVNEYFISKTVLSADVVINVPKLKVHEKAGITCCLKNFIGINGDKSWIPHYRIGSPADGGDAYPKQNTLLRMRSYLVSSLQGRNRLFNLFAVPWRFYKKVVKLSSKITLRENKANVTLVSIGSEGAWYGNDTLWRSIIDLNLALQYSDKNGVIHSKPQRVLINVVDAVICGENHGPLFPDPVESKFILGSFDPYSCDVVAATLIGFDWRKIPSVGKGFTAQSARFSSFKGELESIEVVGTPSFIAAFQSRTPYIQLKPYIGWIGHIELDVKPMIGMASK